MNKPIIIILLAFLFIIPLISAEVQTLGVFKVKECVDLKQSCSNCTYSNISVVTYPDSTNIVSEVVMQKVGIIYNYTFCNTTKLGEYIVTGHSDVDGIKTNWGYDFEITPSGFGTIGSGEGTSIAMAIVVMLIIAIAFILGGTKMPNIALQIIGIGIGAVILLATVLFSMVILMQVVGGFSSIISGYETFWFIIKILTGIGILCLLIFAILFAWKLWMIKKGFRDD